VPDVSALREELIKLASTAETRNWDALLNERKRQELEFHNQNRDDSRTHSLSATQAAAERGNKRYYSTVALSQTYVDNWLARHVPGKVFLDYACGNGEKAVDAASKGASISIGLDISDISVKNARAAAAAAGFTDRCVFLQGDCENTGLPDASVDVVLCSGMLHHLDLSYAYPELRRILKPGGRILAVEALNYNPLIKAYRMLTPEMRTDWEKRHILSLADVRFAARFFDIGEVRFWHLLSPTAAFFSSGPVRAIALRLMNSVDHVLTRVPGLRLMSWQFTFELIRAAER
jgi:ubiquinone/menaquinone biosynthesis C-methylase UbiE